MADARLDRIKFTMDNHEEPAGLLSVAQMGRLQYSAQCARLGL